MDPNIELEKVFNSLFLEVSEIDGNPLVFS